MSLFFTIQSHSYHKSKFINSANYVTGGIYKKTNGIKQYFNLKEEIENYISHWKWFVVGVFITFLIAFVILRYSQNQYLVSTTILIFVALPVAEA